MHKRSRYLKSILTKEYLYTNITVNGLTTKDIIKNLGCGKGIITRLRTKFKIKTKKEDLSGRRFGKIIVLKRLKGYLYNNTNYKCKCDCGKIFNVLAGNLRAKLGTKSCGCVKSPKGKLSKYWKGYEDISGRYFSIVKANASERKITFKLKIEDIWNQFLKQDKKCALTGWSISFIDNCGEKQTASIDRIDSNKDYTIDNIQIVHKDLNWLKNDYDNDYFVKMCIAVAKHKGKNE